MAEKSKGKKEPAKKSAPVKTKAGAKSKAADKKVAAAKSEKPKAAAEKIVKKTAVKTAPAVKAAVPKATSSKKMAAKNEPASPAGPRVQIIKKEDVLRRKAVEAAKEQAAKEALEKEIALTQQVQKDAEERAKPSSPAMTYEIPPQIKEKLASRAEAPFQKTATHPPAAKAEPAPPVSDLPVKIEPSAISPAAPAQPGAKPKVAAAKKPVAEPVRRKEEREEKQIHPDRLRTALAEAPQVTVSPAAEGPLVPIQVSFPVTLGELAPKLNKTPTELIKVLMLKGTMMTINQRLDEEIAKKIASDFGFALEVVDPLALGAAETEIEDPSKLKPRPPVVTVMGHVDHGKTSLLDALRQTTVAAGEEGGITQRIGAYQVELKDRKITFLDTPGHEAFTAMRARGTKITDVAVLVVAADDGVMPQTVEALDHARAANVPVMVAVNKIDKPNANVDRVKQQLSEHGLIPEEWGGTTVFVPISAKQKTGLDELLEMILLVADLAEMKANPDKPARGTIIEAKLDRGKGPVATVLIQQGTFRTGDAFVAGATYGKVRALVSDHGGRIAEAPPAFPVEIIGLNDVPEAGDLLQVVADEKIARQIAEARVLHTREKTLASLKRVTLDDLYQQIQEGEIKDLNLILKADGQGSVEALKDSLERLTTSEIRVRVIHTGVGTITESDVMLASASNAIVIGYNIRPEPHIKLLAEREKVDLRLYRVIYQAIEDITQAMVGMRKPELRESVVGRAEVLQTFKISKVGTIAGCRVTDGKIVRDASVRVIRDGAVVYEGKLSSLKRFKDDAKEVAAGFECGLGIEKFNDIKVGDVLEAFVIAEVRHTTLAGKIEE